MAAEQVTSILNIAFLIIIVFGALMGSFRGFHKSMFYLVLSAIFLILAVLMIPYLSEALLKMNIGFLKRFLPIEGEIAGNTLKEMIPAFLQAQFPEQQALFVEGSETMNLMFGVIKLVLSLVLILIYFLFAITIQKVLMIILYQFVKPDKEKVKKRKLTGALVGAGRGFLVVFLLAIPLVGISSIYESSNKIISQMSSEEEGDSLENTLESFEFLGSYKDTWVAKVLKGGKEGQGLDVAVFDTVFRVETTINGKKETIKIRKELEVGLAIYETILEATDGVIDEEIIFKLTDEDITTIQTHINKTDILKIIQAVAAEVAYSYIIENELDRDYEELLTLSNLKAIDLKKDVVTILEIAKMVNEMEFTGDIEENIFIFDEEQLAEVIDTIVTIEWLKYGLPLGVNFALGYDDFKDIMIEYHINAGDIVKPTEDELLSDIENIKAIYAIIQEMGLTEIGEFENLLESEYIKNLTDEDIEDIVDALFGFETLDKNKKILAAFIHSTIADNEDFGDVIDQDHFMDNFTKEEIKHIMVIIKVLFDGGITEEDFDIQTLLTDENIDKLAQRVSKSEILSYNMKELIHVLVTSSEVPYTIEIPSNVTFKGLEGEEEIKSFFKTARFLMDSNLEIQELTDTEIDELATLISKSKIMKHNMTALLTSEMVTAILPSIVVNNTADDWTKEEIYYTMKSFIIVANDLSNISAISDLSDEKIDEISESISKSRTMRDNISELLSNQTEGTSFDFIKPNYPQTHWTRDELYYTIKSFQIFEGNNLSSDTVNTLTDEDIEIIANSITISDIISQEIEKMTITGGVLEGKLLFVPGLTWNSTPTEAGELENFLKGVKETLGGNALSTYNPNIDELFDKDIDIVFTSKLLEKTLVENQIIPLTTGTLGDYLEEKDRDGEEFIWLKDESGNSDSIDFVKALRDLMELGVDYNNIDLLGIKTTLNQPVGPGEDPMTVQVEQAFMQSRIFMHSMNKLMDKVTFGNPGNIFNYDENTDWENGGLLAVLEQIKDA